MRTSSTTGWSPVSALRDASATIFSWRRVQNARKSDSAKAQPRSQGEMRTAVAAAPATARRTKPAAITTTST